MLLTELQILPPISTFSDGMRNGGLIIEAFENYQKKSLRNRFFLSSSNGRISISIPLQKGKSNQLKIKDVRVSYDENWIKNIHHTLTTVLGRSAFFEHYIDSVMGIFYSNIETLWDLNRALLQWAVEAGEISLKVDYTESYIRKDSNTHKDFRNKPLSSYHNPTSNNYIEYDQIFMMEHGFIRNLSILDLIMNRGPETGLLINNHVNNSYLNETNN